VNVVDAMIKKSKQPVANYTKWFDRNLKAMWATYAVSMHIAPKMNGVMSEYFLVVLSCRPGNMDAAVATQYYKMTILYQKNRCPKQLKKNN
jgi:hypothetical protein